MPIGFPPIVELRTAGQLSGQHGYWLRASDAAEAPWQFVEGAEWGFWTDPGSDTRIYYMTFRFRDGTERMCNQNDEIEVGWTH